MPDHEVHDIILTELRELREDVKKHPVECPLITTMADQGKQIHALEKREAWRSGATGAIGVVVGTGLSLFGKELIRLLRIP